MSYTSDTGGTERLQPEQLQIVVEEQRRVLRSDPILHELRKWKPSGNSEYGAGEEGIMLFLALGDISSPESEGFISRVTQLALALEIRDHMVISTGSTSKKLVIRDCDYQQYEKQLLEASFHNVEVQLMTITPGPALVAAFEAPDFDPDTLCVGLERDVTYNYAGQQYCNIDLLYDAYLPLDQLANLLLLHKPRSLLTSDLYLASLNLECLSEPHNSFDDEMVDIFEVYDSDESEFEKLHLDGEVSILGGTQEGKMALSSMVLYCPPEDATNVGWPCKYT